MQNRNRIEDDVEPNMTGEINYEMRKFLKTGLIAALIAILGVAAFAFISFFAVPFALSVIATSFFFGSVMYLAGISYGIVNDIIGTKKNLPYFSLGHQPGQKGIIKSNDPKAVGVAWGVFATAGLTIPAAILFTATTLIMGFFLPLATFILPLIVALVPIVLIASCISANRKEKERKQGIAKDQEDFNQLKKEILLPQDQFELQTGYTSTGYIDEYQKPRLRAMLKNEDEVNSWFTNSDRNIGGFIGMPVVGVLGLASVITFSAAYYVLPAIFFTATLAVFPPLAIGLLLVAGVVAACCYLAIKHKTQIKNRFNLNYETKNSERKKNSDQQASFSPTHAVVGKALGVEGRSAVQPNIDNNVQVSHSAAITNSSGNLGAHSTPYQALNDDGCEVIKRMSLKG